MSLPSSRPMLYGSRPAWYPREISEGARPQPWIPAGQLLRRVPRDRPRLLFPADSLEEMRALGVEVPPEPDYDDIKDPAKRRLAYFDSFHARNVDSVPDPGSDATTVAPHIDFFRQVATL